MAVSKGLMETRCFEVPSEHALTLRPPDQIDILMIMGRRSGVIDDEESLSTLGLKELDRKIAYYKLRLDLAGGRVLERAFEKRLHKLERIRRRVAAGDS